MIFNTFKKEIKISLLFVFLFIIFSIPTHVKAQGVFVPVNDAILNATAASMLIVEEQTSIATVAQTIKEVGQVPGLVSPVNQVTGQALAFTSLDFAANAMAKILIQTLTNSIVSWIDSGFQGQPAFITDPEGFFLDVADSAAGEFITELVGDDSDFLCEPFELQIQFGLDYRYQSTFEDTACRLSDIWENVSDFADFTDNGNFASGGWDGWFRVIQPQYNPYGSYIEAESELGVRIAGKQNLELLKLNWGSGFLSFQKCLDEDENGNVIEDRSLAECKNKSPIKTPGSIIETGLSDALGTQLSQYQLADSFDKILNALLNQLISKALGSSGLVG